jgi:hypothetical protein
MTPRLRTLLLVPALLGAALALPVAPVRAETPPALSTPAVEPYRVVELDERGAASAAELEGAVEHVSAAVRAGAGQVVVVVHGFNTTPREAEAAFRAIAGRLQDAAPARRVAVLGLRWRAEVGSGWLVQAAGHRVARLLGARRAMRNPYLEKVSLARRSGRQGLRALLLRLQERLPDVPVSAFAHSLGAQVVVSALDPAACAGKDGTAAVEPEREVRLRLAALAGADLDHNVFSRRNGNARAALDRVDVWWITTPAAGGADGVLELRRGAGRGEAVGNRGLDLLPEDLDALVARRALVVDEGEVPATHLLDDYFSATRVSELAAALRYLEQPDDPYLAGTTLARLDAVLRGGSDGSASGKLYAAWSASGDTAGSRSVRVVDAPGRSRVAGSRQELRTSSAAAGAAERQAPEAGTEGRRG